MQRPIIVNITNEVLILKEQVSPTRWHKWYAISTIQNGYDPEQQLSELYAFPPNMRPIRCIYFSSGNTASDSNQYAIHILLGVGPITGLEGENILNNQIYWRVVTPASGWDNTRGIRTDTHCGIWGTSPGVIPALPGARGGYISDFVFPVLAKEDYEAYYLRFIRNTTTTHAPGRQAHATLIIEEVNSG